MKAMERLTEARLQSHIDECKHRIDNINNFVSNNSDADKEECAKNIAVLINVINVLEEYKENKDAEEQGLLIKIPCHCKDCSHWVDGCAGCTEHVKLCDVGHYMVGENGYCLYAEQKARIN